MKRLKQNQNLYRKWGRTPTNVELFDLGQSNSEHSRHWFFSGKLYTVKNGEKVEFAYFVENKWRKRVKSGKIGARQKVKGYLGRVFRVDRVNEKGFFDHKNKEGTIKRLQYCQTAMEDMVKYLNGEGEIGIIDATNTTLKRRNFIRSFLTTNLQNFQLL